ncbi:MAG: hypothetical protein K0S38_88 [Candidatus Paceibacter sp.]|nr:hypothetical protein [Candidatus Paceibacter sp.]
MIQKILGKKVDEACCLEKAVPLFEKCAEENERGEQWELMCDLGLSIAIQRDLKPDRFYCGSMWQKPCFWMRRNSKPAYRLVNKKPVIVGDIAVCTRLLLVDSERAKLETVAQMCLVHYAVTDQYLLPDVVDQPALFHSSIIIQGYVTLIGGESDSGLVLYNLPQGVFRGGIPGVGAIICRNTK